MSAQSGFIPFGNQNLQNQTNHTNGGTTNHINHISQSIPKHLSDHSQYFLPGANLSEQEMKYCMCVLQVAAKQPGSCNLEKAWYETRDDRVCYNPYAVCARSVGTTSRDCGKYYNFDTLPDNLIQAYMNLNQITIPEPFDRNSAITYLKEWKVWKYGL